MSAAVAMLRRRQWVAFGGFSCSVMFTTCLTLSGVSGLIRDGRVASLSNPFTFCGVFRPRARRSNRSRSAAPIEIRSIFLIGADSQVRADLCILCQQQNTREEI